MIKKIQKNLIGKINIGFTSKLLILIILITNIKYTFALYQSDILPSDSGGNIKSSIQTQSITGLFSYIKDSIFGLLAIVVVGVFIFIGIRLVVSRGNAEEFKKALLQLVYAVAGLFIVSVAYLAVKLVSGLSIN